MNFHSGRVTRDKDILRLKESYARKIGIVMAKLFFRRGINPIAGPDTELAPMIAQHLARTYQVNSDCFNECWKSCLKSYSTITEA